MITAAIDTNDKSTWTAYNDTTGQIERVYCDPITGALFVFSVSVDANVPTTLLNAKIDANDNATTTALNSTTGNIECLRCGTNGELLISPQ